MIQAGKLNKKVKIQSKGSLGKDEYGAQTFTWEDDATVWAEIKPLSGQELVQAQQINAETKVLIRIRYRSGVSTENRILYGSRIYEITAVINTDEANIELVLHGKEI